MERRSPDPETGVYYARRRAPTQDPPADASKRKRWNFKTFMFLRGRLVLMLVGLCGGSMVMSLLNPPLADGSSNQLLSSIKTFPGQNERIDPIPVQRKLQAESEEEQQRGEKQVKKGNSKTPRWAAAAAKRPRRGRLEAALAEAAAEEEKDEEEGEMFEEGVEAEEEKEEEDEDGWGEGDEGKDGWDEEDGGEQEEEEEEKKEHIASLAERLMPRRKDMEGLDLETREAIERMALDKLLQKDGGKGLAAAAQEAADRVREKQEEAAAPIIDPGPRDPSLPTHASVALAEAQAILVMLARTEEEQQALDAERAVAVKGAIMHAWDGYKQWAWGMDELAPVSKGGLKWFGLGLTLVDSLDLLWLIGEKDEFQGARDWVATELNVDQDVHVNVFETTIRVMGGLLSAYHYSHDEIFLSKAQSLGTNLRLAMNSPSGVPWSDAILATKQAFAPVSAPESSISEATSIQLEFKYLAHASKDESLYRLAEHSMRAVDAARAELPTEGHKQALLPMFINAETGKFNQAATITLGARGDSYYEYLLKQWLLTGKREEFYKQRYLEAVKGIKSELFRHSEPEGKAFIAELGRGVNFSPKMDHLVCYLPGTLALGVYHGLDPEGGLGHMEMARELMVTCFEFYNQTITGLSPEIAFFRVESSNTAEPPLPGASDLYVKPRDTHNILRPETVESLFYMYRVTGERVYQEWAWQIFVAFERHAKIETGGYSGLQNVEVLDSARIDKMESFFLGETLKYFYLLFADPAVLSLDEVVFNTEAHPFPVMAVEEDWLLYKGKGEQPAVGGGGKEKEKEGMEVKAEAEEVEAEEEEAEKEEEEEEEEGMEEKWEELEKEGEEEEEEALTAQI